MKTKIKKKIRGVALITTVAAVAAWILLSYGIFITQSSQFQMIGAGKTAMEAQQYAEIDANLLKLVNYDQLDNAEALSAVKLHKGRAKLQTVDVTGWEDEISIGKEQTNGGKDDDGVFRVATVKIYKQGDTTPRYSVDVPLVKGAQTMTAKEIQALVDSLQSQINQLSTNLTAYENATNANLSNLQNQINKNADTISKNLTYLKGLIDKNQAAIAAANININKNAANISTINGKINNIQSQISSINSTVSALRKDLNAEISARKSADSNLQGQINSNKSNIATNKTAIAAVKSDVSTLKSQFSQLKSDLASLTGRVNGNEFAKNDDVTNRVSFKYDETEKKLKAYVDNNPVDMFTNSHVPVGTILPWHGDVNRIPYSFALCDGNNGTPDLRNRFIVGAGDEYTIDDIGGEKEVLLEAEQTSSHFHTIGYHHGSNGGYFLTTGPEFFLGDLNIGYDVFASKWNGAKGGGWYGWDYGGQHTFTPGQNMVTSRAIGVDATKPHENRPPFYAVYFIMKIFK